jgi:hypothetical protein
LGEDQAKRSGVVRKGRASGIFIAHGASAKSHDKDPAPVCLILQRKGQAKGMRESPVRKRSLSDYLIYSLLFIFLRSS